MNAEKIREFFDRVPFFLIFILLAGWPGYQLYDFLTSPDSELQMRRSAVEETKNELDKLELRVKELEKFKATIDEKRELLRQSAKELEATRASLGAEIDVPAFIKMVITEAKKLGMDVLSIQPKAVVKRELYNEQPFDIQIKGIYIQTLVFMQRLSRLQNIVRIQNFNLVPQSGNRPPGRRYVDLTGKIEINAYSYRELDKKEEPERDWGQKDGGKKP